MGCPVSRAERVGPVLNGPPDTQFVQPSRQRQHGVAGGHRLCDHTVHHDTRMDKKSVAYQSSEILGALDMTRRLPMPGEYPPAPADPSAAKRARTIPSVPQTSPKTLSWRKNFVCARAAEPSSTPLAL